MLEKRGRKSFADLESVPVVPLDPADGRPEPPADLSPREAEVWRDAVAVMPARHFSREKWPVLRGYVRHVIAADAAWALYEAALKDRGVSVSARELKQLQLMHGRESDAVRHASRHLGLLVVNRHARQVPRYAPTPPVQLQPWEL